MTADMDACLNRGRIAHERAGSTSIHVSENSVRGYRGNAVGVIVCVPERKLAFFYTAGAGGDVTLYRNALKGGF